MSSRPAANVDLREWVDAIADQFEQAWGSLTPPRIDDFLGNANGARRAALLEELVLLDLEWRARLGARRSLQDYRSDYPELVASNSPRAALFSAASASSQTTVPGYEDVVEIGRGGMGVVYRARQVGLNRRVALKMILTGVHADAEELQRFRLEAEAVARLEHPNIVRIYEVGELDGRPFFALEYVDGGTLEERLAHTPQPPREAAALVEKLARAMHFAHQRGIVHRDLKPANVLLSGAGASATSTPQPGANASGSDETVPKITDFGLAKRLDSDLSNTCSGTVLGTPYYMAPEQARGQGRQVGPAADVHALGAILYEMLVGRPPFQGSTALETLEQVCTQEPVPPRRLQPRVPRDLETICLKCLRKEPAHRYASADELGDDLRRFLGGQSIRARPIMPWEHAVKWIRRNKARSALAVMSLLMAAGIAGWAHHARKQRESNAATHAADLVASLASAETADVPHIIDALTPYRLWADPLLYQRLAITSPESKEHLHLRMALAPVSASQVEYLCQRLLTARPEDVATIQGALAQHQDVLNDRLWAILENRSAAQAQRVRAACALAAHDASDGRWSAVARDVAQGLAAEPMLAQGKGKELLLPIKRHLSDPLLEIYLDGQRQETERTAAFAVLTEHASDRPEVLAALDTEASDQQHLLLLPLLRAHREQVMSLLREVLHKGYPTVAGEEERDRQARRQARAAVLLLQLGEPESLWALLPHRPDPSVRTHLLHELGPRGADATILINRLEMETDVSARRALILALGEFTGEQISSSQRERLVPSLLRWYRDDPDPGIHGAIDWLLRHGQQGDAPRKLDWQKREALDRIDLQLAGLPPSPRHWYVTAKYQLTMTVIRAPIEFIMGTPYTDLKDKNSNEAPHRVKVPRSYALATKEITVAQFRRFLDENPRVKARHSYQKQSSPTDDGPILGVTWFQAAQFCNWLSQQEGLPRSEWCYPDLEELGYGMELPADYLRRQGYRLPTEAEWEYACRAGATTSRFFGASEEMLKEYAWYSKTSNKRAYPVGQLKPNDFGLFDICGNAMEWCQDQGDDYQVAPNQDWIDREDAALRITRAQARVIRGGSFFYLGRSVRSAFRDYYRPDFPLLYVGFRPARTLGD